MQRSTTAVRDAIRIAMDRRTPDKPAQAAYHVDQPSMVRRVRALLDVVTPESRVLFVGDDDLTSVALHRLGVTQITVVDFDEELLGIVKDATGGAARTVRADLRGVYDGKLPRLARGSFDLFLTDPPYGADGLRVFTGVGLEALRVGGLGFVVHPVGRAAVTSVGDPDTLTWTLQRFALDSGATVVDVHPASQRSYHGTVSSMTALRRIDARRVDFACLEGPRSFY